jgi:ABC-type dipeptide/oligopeptide/nickel transport system permease component/ABC-type transport system substrate-binding protein
MKKRSVLTSVLGFLAAAVAFAGLLSAFAWVMRPDMSAEPPAYPPEEVRAAEEARATKIDPNRPLVLHRKVDYSEGESARWYPKGQSPLLDELVREGTLPPVAERVGPEPAVVEGVEGLGRYGGTWIRIGNGDNDVFGVLGHRMSAMTLVRWSPHGYPLVPHAAKGYEVSPDYRSFTFALRKGMKWSDGQPFSAVDILYWWHHEANDELLSGGVVPRVMNVAGKSGRIWMFEVVDKTGRTRPLDRTISGRPGRIEEFETVDASGRKRTIPTMLVEVAREGGSSAPADANQPPQFEIKRIDPYRLRITFPEPNGLFLAKLATYDGAFVLGSPAHYLWPYHPNIGAPKRIEEMMRARKLASPLAVYRTVKGGTNPEHPRLWPWVYRTHRPNAPYSFVRNPYYCMVDTAGNQLPYVDRAHFEVKSGEMIGVSASNGEITMQARHMRYDQYTLLMSQRRRSGYDVLHWYAGDRSTFIICPNLNRKVDPNRPETIKKHELLNEKKFRQALSLAIDRGDIIDAEFNGQTVPAQCVPGPASYFYDPAAYKSYTRHDPNEANRLLDEIGLTKRDYEGFRTFRDGSRMLLYLNTCLSGLTAVGPGQFIVDDWQKVGIRAILRVRSRRLFYTEKAAREHDLNVWGGNGEYLPILAPRYLVPIGGESNYAPAFAKWYVRGGLYGDPKSKGPGCVEPSPGHGLRRAMEIYERVNASGDPAEQRETFREVLRLAAENVWTINVCTPPPAIAVVRKGFRNVPKTAVAAWDFLTPANAGIETYYFERNADTPGAIRQIQDSIRKVTPPPDAPAAVAEADASASLVGTLIRYLFVGIGVLLAVLVAVMHPYIGRRMLIMVPTLLIISVIVFTIIQLPPGDYVTSRIMELQEAGDTAQLKEIEDLKTLFHLEDPMPVRYARWLGLVWFTTFEGKDEGLLQGNLGRSMENSRPVNQIVGDRILLTVLISLGTILFTWAIAIPTGVFSAVRQYSLWDYVLTFVGFIGMCVPSFLLALILMYLSKRVFGWEISGLFSSQYGAQPEWDWPKALDLLKHIWVPVVVLGVGGTAGMIRVMRGNLLDELKKPYVTTARAKGVRPTKLLLKYPVRMALNPFISGIGYLFPQLVSGGAIVAMVLSLPTVGPLMLQALMSEDMYLAGSMLMVLSLLGVFGTLVSDLLLLWLDPRIRFRGGTR